MITEVSPLIYLDRLCEDGKPPRWARSGYSLANKAINFGCLNILRYSKTKHIPQNVCSLAAKKGHLHILCWAKSFGYSWDEETCSAAAFAGHLEILQWLRANRWFRFAKFYVKYSFT